MPGESENVHTAIAAEGERNLLAFDLVVTVPAEGEPTPKYHVAVTNIVPEEKARPNPFGVQPKPEVKHVADLACEFAEPFQAYVLGDDYYFLTKSGLVYRSPPTAKGKPRTMAAVWGKDQPRVRYIISDGNTTGVHFLVFYQEKDGKGAWAFVRVGPDPKPTTLDADVKPDTAPVEAVYELARALVKAKEIAAPPTPKKP